MTKGFAFHLRVPAGQTRDHDGGECVLPHRGGGYADVRVLLLHTLFNSVDSVIDAAFAGLADAQMRCQQLAVAMANAGLNPYRQFLASHAMHSYMANTVCLMTPSGTVVGG